MSPANDLLLPQVTPLQLCDVLQVYSLRNCVTSLAVANISHTSGTEEAESRTRFRAWLEQCTYVANGAFNFMLTWTPFICPDIAAAPSYSCPTSFSMFNLWLRKMHIICSASAAPESCSERWNCKDSFLIRDVHLIQPRIWCKRKAVHDARSLWRCTNLNQFYLYNFTGRVTMVTKCWKKSGGGAAAPNLPPVSVLDGMSGLHFSTCSSSSTRVDIYDYMTLE